MILSYVCYERTWHSFSVTYISYLQNLINSIGSSLFGRTISKKSAIGTVLRKINIKREAQEQEKNLEQIMTSQETTLKSTSLTSSINDKSNLLVDRHFKIRDTQENGNLSVRKLKGLKRDSEILFVAPPAPSSTHPIDDIDTSSNPRNEGLDLVRKTDDMTKLCCIN